MSPQYEVFPRNLAWLYHELLGSPQIGRKFFLMPDNRAQLVVEEYQVKRPMSSMSPLLLKFSAFKYRPRIG